MTHEPSNDNERQMNRTQHSQTRKKEKEIETKLRTLQSVSASLPSAIKINYLRIKQSQIKYVKKILES